MDQDKLASLTALIAKEISYDASEINPAVRCQHCGKNARDAHLSYWIDHREVLTGMILDHLGLSRRLHGNLDQVLADEYVTGKDTEDAPGLAKAVMEAFFD